MLFRALTLLFCFLFAVWNTVFAEEKEKKRTLPWTFNAKVDFILDGDSVRLKGIEENIIMLVSLYGIDSPEMAQPFGPRAKEYVEKALWRKKFKVTVIKLGPYNTALAYIHVDNKDIGYMMVENGLAEVDPGTIRAFVDPEEKKRYLAVQEKARKSRTGMWIQGEKYESPLKFLRKKKFGK